MSRRLVFVIAAGLALSGCCLESRNYFQPQPKVLASWERPGAKRHLRPAKVQKASEAASNDSSTSEQELSKLKPYSKEWAAALNAINRAEDEKLKRKMIICRDCVPPEPTDQTGSIAAGGYIPARQ
jgi:hypothetical protein